MDDGTSAFDEIEVELTDAGILGSLSKPNAVSSSQRVRAVVDLNAGNDSRLLEDIDEEAAILRLLVHGLVEKDHAADRISRPGVVTIKSR